MVLMERTMARAGTNLFHPKINRSGMCTSRFSIFCQLGLNRSPGGALTQYPIPGPILVSKESALHLFELIRPVFYMGTLSSYSEAEVGMVSVPFFITTST